GIPSRFVSQRHGDGDGSRVSQAADVPGPAADAPLLLPGVAEPQRPAPFSRPIGRKQGGPGRVRPQDDARTVIPGKSGDPLMHVQGGLLQHTDGEATRGNNGGNNGAVAAWRWP